VVWSGRGKKKRVCRRTTPTWGRVRARIRERRQVKCGSVAWVGDTFHATLQLVPTFETHLWLSGSSDPRQIPVGEDHVATHVALVVPPPLVSARAWRPPRALVSPVSGVSRRRIILHRTSCLCQPAPYPPRCRHPRHPPTPLTAGAPPSKNSDYAHCIPSPSTAALSYGRPGRLPKGKEVMVLRVEVWRSIGRCCSHRGRCCAVAVDVESSNRVDRYLNTCRR